MEIQRYLRDTLDFIINQKGSYKDIYKTIQNTVEYKDDRNKTTN